jgi:hypothetical protein
MGGSLTFPVLIARVLAGENPAEDIVYSTPEYASNCCSLAKAAMPCTFHFSRRHSQPLHKLA